MQAKNDLTAIKLRRYENILTMSGMAVIAFSIWSIIKAAAYFLTQSYDTYKLLGKDFEHEMNDLSNTINQQMGHDVSSTVHFTVSGVILGFVFLVLVLDLLFRYYIGKSAITESKGRHKKGILYILMAFVVCLSLIATLYSRIRTALIGFGGSDTNNDVQLDPTLDTVLASNLVDLTALIALMELIIAAFMVRHLRKQLGIIIPTKKEWKLEKKESRLQKKEIKKQKRAQEV